VRRVVGESGIALPLDVTRLESIDAFVAEVKNKFGRIDVLVNNAGYGNVGRSRTPAWPTFARGSRRVYLA
jgi:NAD(P)-dependent dehydrogenase (short-subunit alcohol dehydrogenase family)